MDSYPAVKMFFYGKWPIWPFGSMIYLANIGEFHSYVSSPGVTSPTFGVMLEKSTCGPSCRLATDVSSLVQWRGLPYIRPSSANYRMGLVKCLLVYKAHLNAIIVMIDMM